MRSIIFDFDGVIADTFDIALQLSREMDGHPFTPEEYRRLFDGNLFAVADTMKLPTFATDERRRYFAKIYGERIHHGLVYPGMTDVLAHCAGRSLLHIVSSGGETVIRGVLAAANCEKYFDKILGFETHSSKVHKFRMLGVDENEADNHLFITDTLGDLLEAKEVGMPAIAVSWGYHDASRLSRGNPRAIVHTPNELLKAILDMRYTKE